jgi:hypothetical protein
VLVVVVWFGEVRGLGPTLDADVDVAAAIDGESLLA